MNDDLVYSVEQSHFNCRVFPLSKSYALTSIWKFNRSRVFFSVNYGVTSCSRIGSFQVYPSRRPSPVHRRTGRRSLGRRRRHCRPLPCSGTPFFVLVFLDLRSAIGACLCLIKILSFCFYKVVEYRHVCCLLFGVDLEPHAFVLFIDVDVVEIGIYALSRAHTRASMGRAWIWRLYKYWGGIG